jgi:hypothetical protein
MKTLFRYYTDVFVIVTLLWSMLLAHQVHTSIIDNRNSNDDDDDNNNNNSNSEVTYVNSGQSVLLVCDLPNSMPDGQVCVLLWPHWILFRSIRIFHTKERK